MKNQLLLLSLIVTLFTGCSKDEIPRNEPNDLKRIGTLSGVKLPQVNTKGIAQKNNLWRAGLNLRIKFLDGSLEDQEKVKGYASEWMKYANVKFKYVTEGRADIRITFNDADKYITWSYTGTDAKSVVDQNMPTASIADFDILDETENKANVLRLFGQILGLDLEHRHFSVDPQWKRDMEDFWMSDVKDIPWETLKRFVFDPIDADEDIETTKAFDPLSIMKWTFPRYTNNKDLLTPNDTLSDVDKEFISSLYPYIEPDLGKPLEIINVRVTFGRYDYTSGSKNVRQGYYRGMCGDLKHLEGGTISYVPALFSNSYGGGGTIGRKGIGMQAKPSDASHLYDVIKIQMTYNNETTTAYRYEVAETPFGQYYPWNDVLMADDVTLNPDAGPFLERWYSVPDGTDVDVRIEFYNTTKK